MTPKNVWQVTGPRFLAARAIERAAMRGALAKTSSSLTSLSGAMKSMSSDGRKKVERSICAWNLPGSLDWTTEFNMVKHNLDNVKLSRGQWRRPLDDPIEIMRTCSSPRSCGNWLMQDHQLPQKAMETRSKHKHARETQVREKQKAQETASMNQQIHANTVDYVHTCAGWSESFTRVWPSWINSGTAQCVPQGVRKGNSFHWPFAQLSCEYHRNQMTQVWVLPGLACLKDIILQLDGLGLGDMLLQIWKPEAPMWNQKDF